MITIRPNIHWFLRLFRTEKEQKKGFEMTPKAEEAIRFVLRNEGGFSDNVFDSGQSTNHGVSLRFLRNLPSEKLKKYGIFKAPIALVVDDIRELTEVQAMVIYENEFWQEAPFEKISWQQVCNYLFDMCVNHGISHGIKILQHAIWDVEFKRDGLGVVDDGILGNLTLDAIEYLDAHNSGEFLVALTAERCAYYRMLVEISPKNKEFLNGWLDRAFRI